MIPVSIAPMMDWTDRHYRYFARRFTTGTLLYTEMVTAAAIIHGDRERLLGFHPDEHPISLQLGGDDPDQLARALEIAHAWGYDEYNLNAGCPSDRVQSGSFGACLMADPARVVSLVQAMRSVTDRPVTIKHRIGIDGRESYQDMLEFVDTVAGEGGITRFTVHARIAILQGLSPKDNRSIPPLRYGDVYRLKRERPDLLVELNGGVKTVAAVQEHLRHVDAVMIGRAAYANPSILAEIDHAIFGTARSYKTREQVVREMIPYVEAVTAGGAPPRVVFNHMLGLFAGKPGARSWKRALSGRLPDQPAPRILEEALMSVPEQTRQDLI